MFGKTRNPKLDLISQATERRTRFPQLALRRRADDHPMVLFSTVVSAAFIWALVPADSGVTYAAAKNEPARIVQETKTTAKTSRLSMSDVDRACMGQSWGGESAECVTTIAREGGKADLKVRMIADAAPSDLDTPNVF